MLTKEEKNRLKNMVKENKTFHYSYVDRLRQEVKFYVNLLVKLKKAWKY